MYNVAIVEDRSEDRDILQFFLSRYSENTAISFSCECFENAITFLSNYKPVYDIVFIDIKMPYMDGMEAAERLRKVDADVPLVFITNMSSEAVRGYSVNAVDFVVKPVQYPVFRAMLDKVLRVVQAKSKAVLLKTKDGFVRVLADKIYCLDINGHLLKYRTEDGEFSVWGTLKEEMTKLPSEQFARANNYCIVNLKFVSKISDGEIVLDGVSEKIPISRSKKSAFMDAFMAYCGKFI